MVKNKVLKSGVRLVVNEMKGFEGVSFKLFVFVGSGNEKVEKNYGISHLIEHMLFKGTKTRSSLDLVKEFDKFGIQTNAYTSKTATCFYTYGTKDSLDKSVELLADMFFNSTFDEKELEKEKLVVTEEIKMYEDLPDATCERIMDMAFYENTSFAHDILGTEESVLNISREQILNYLNENYIPKNIVLSFAGNVSLAEAEKLVNNYFEKNFQTPSFFEYCPVTTQYNINKKQNVLIKNTKQAQIKISFKSANYYNEIDIFKNAILSEIVGGGMSSRLFQEIREKQGLVYSISSQNETTPIAGMFSIVFGSSHKNVCKALKTISNELKNIINKGFTQEELNRAKNVLINFIKLQMDKPATLASKHAYQLQNYNKILNKEERIKNYEKITLDDINNQAKEIFTGNYCITMVSSKEEDLLKEFDL